MKTAALAQIAERVRYYDTMKPYLVVDEAGGGWEWKVYDPRKRTPKGGPTVVAEGSADTRGVAYVTANSELIKLFLHGDNPT